MKAHPRLRRGLAFICAIAFSASSPLLAAGVASGFCDDLHSVIGVNITAPTRPPPDLTKLALFDAPKDCGISQTEAGEIAQHCMAPYPYRSRVALQVFEALNIAMTQCKFTRDRIDEAEAVNHPDSYDQRSYLFGVADAIWRVDLSLKDKATLEQTLLFLRVWKTAE